MASENNPKGRENYIVVQELKGEVLLYDVSIHKGYCLNETSAAIWNLCDGNNSVSDISKQLSKQLKQPVTDDLVYLALDQFKTDNLLSDNEQVEIKFGGLSRREVIRKVGYASLIALPVIASLMAPTAADAASPSTCTTGVCIAVGNDICAGCANQRVNFIFYTSTNGTCSGPGTANFTNCGTGPITINFDIRRT